MKLPLKTRIKLVINDLRGTTKNNAQLLAARQFLKYGNNKVTTPNWSQVIMSDEDMYTGLMYGAIDIRAVTIASLATNNLVTEAKSALMDQARAKRETLVHPYLEIIDTSKTFSNYQFWYTNSTYLDIEGLAYILVIRNVANNLVGKVQEFKLLNPFNVQRIFDPVTKKLLGYKEHKGGTFRDIPIEMIIPIIKLNPFSEEPFAMTDAAKDHQFTLKTAGDYTRSAIAGNMNAPGIIATDEILEGQELENFKARVMAHEKGEPLFGGGTGSIKWQDMQQDLNKAALTDVNTISLQNIIAVSGASKTMLGWEESGTTRDTALIQKDNFIELRAMPQLQLIIDALNQDYKNYYSGEYQKNGYTICIENPLGSDIEEERKKITNRQIDFDLYNALVNKGYERGLAARYADGKITLEELGEPTNEPIDPIEQPPNQATITLKQNEMESDTLTQTQASLQNTITNIDNSLLAAVVNHVGQVKNDFTSQKDIIADREKKAIQNELELALAAFYGIILPLYASNTLFKRLEEYGKATQFRMNNEVRSFIREIAGKASSSHIDTLLDSMVKQAQKDALAGVGRDQVARNLLKRYGGEVTKTRAVAIARTETNRAFTMSQFQADKQFIKQAGFSGKAYKVWRTRSNNPCPHCLAMAAEPPIPFDEPFASVGDELSATAELDGETVVKKMSVGFMDAQAGNLHTNCGCIYELIIK